MAVYSRRVRRARFEAPVEEFQSRLGQRHQPAIVHRVAAIP
jgi:hypothetical protein